MIGRDGDDMQAVILTLGPGDQVRAEAGAMMFMTDSIEMDAKMEGGLLGGLKRKLLAGESFFITHFRATSGPGRVAFAGAYGSYGKVVILDHGDSFYTVYGGLGAFGVRVGDSVSRGTRLGDVAPAQRPAVFFEVRRSTRTLDPRSWTGL